MPEPVSHSQPRWHYSPAATWMNDPNGLIWDAGSWHLFYQSNPEADTWGNMSWGHATSPDLLTWTEHPIALPHNETEEFYSGSCVVDDNNTSGLGSTDWPALIALYTSHYGPSSPRYGTQAQSLAYSLDGGSHWELYAGNPVLDRASANFRDPKVFWHSGSDSWVMVAVEAEHQQVVLYRSPNLLDWTYLSTFGPSHAVDGAWECPDLFPLEVEGTQERRWVLLVSINPGGVAGGSGVQYFVGDFDGVTFTPEHHAAGTELRDYDWLDFGRDCYAVVSFANVPDGRRIVIGWMNNWDYANHVPLTGGRSLMTIPRELTLVRDGDRHRLRQRPIRELPSTELRSETLQDGDELHVRGAVIAYRDGVLSLDRRRAGETSFHDRFPSVQWADIPQAPPSVELRILVDTCSIEIFAADGLVTITDLVFF
ncbi:MAG: glycoside hydrolase family 32 protein [Micropruina sp.]